MGTQTQSKLTVIKVEGRAQHVFMENGHLHPSPCLCSREPSWKNPTPLFAGKSLSSPRLEEYGDVSKARCALSVKSQVVGVGWSGRGGGGWEQAVTSLPCAKNISRTFPQWYFLRSPICIPCYREMKWLPKITGCKISPGGLSSHLVP